MGSLLTVRAVKVIVMILGGDRLKRMERDIFCKWILIGSRVADSISQNVISGRGSSKSFIHRNDIKRSLVWNDSPPRRYGELGSSVLVDRSHLRAVLTRFPQ